MLGWQTWWLLLRLSLLYVHTHTHTHTRKETHTRTHTQRHTPHHTHKHTCYLCGQKFNNCKIMCVCVHVYLCERVCLNGVCLCVGLYGVNVCVCMVCACLCICVCVRVCVCLHGVCLCACACVCVVPGCAGPSLLYGSQCCCPHLGSEPILGTGRLPGATGRSLTPAAGLTGIRGARTWRQQHSTR